MAVLGADVERLDQVAGTFSATAESAERMSAGLRQMVADLEFHGRHGDQFATYLTGSAVPEIVLTAQALRQFHEVLRHHAAAQRGVSAGEGSVEGSRCCWPPPARPRWSRPRRRRGTPGRRPS